MTKECVAHGGALKFQGHIPYPHEQKIDDWGLNAQQQASTSQLLQLLDPPAVDRHLDHPSAAVMLYKASDCFLGGCSTAGVLSCCHSSLCSLADHPAHVTDCRSQLLSSSGGSWRHAMLGAGKTMVGANCCRWNQHLSWPLEACHQCTC